MPIWQQGRRAIACLALFIAASAAHAATKVTVTSPAGETLLGGVGTRTYNTVVADLQPGHVIINASEAGQFLFIELRAPVDQTLEDGSYLNAEMIDQVTGTAPGMRVIAPSGGCADAWGSFKIRQFDANRLEATFVYRCGSATAPALTGTILVDAGPRYFSYSRDAGFPLGTVAARTYYGDNGATSLSGYQSGFQVGVSGQRDEWIFMFTPPVGKVFAKGIYPLDHSPDATRAGLYIHENHGAFCDGMTGSVNVRNIAYDGDGNVTGMYATWTLYCSGQPAAYRATFHHDL
jgi:hypothetical protein